MDPMLPPPRPAILGSIVRHIVSFGVFQIAFAAIFLIVNVPFPVVALIADLLIVLGAVNFAAAAGLHQMRRWGWWAAIVILSLDVIFTFPIATVRAIRQLGDLNTPDVREVFGREATRSQAPYRSASHLRRVGIPDPSTSSRRDSRPLHPYQTPSALLPTRCLFCGAPLGAGAITCPSCGARVR